MTRTDVVAQHDSRGSRTTLCSFSRRTPRDFQRSNFQPNHMSTSNQARFEQHTILRSNTRAPENDCRLTVTHDIRTRSERFADASDCLDLDYCCPLTASAATSSALPGHRFQKQRSTYFQVVSQQKRGTLTSHKARLMLKLTESSRNTGNASIAASYETPALIKEERMLTISQQILKNW